MISDDFRDEYDVLRCKVENVSGFSRCQGKVNWGLFLKSS